MPMRNASRPVVSLASPFAFAGLILIAAYGLTVPAAAQFSIGIGMGDGGLMMPMLQDAPPPPYAASSGERRPRQARRARSHDEASGRRHVKEAGTAARDSDSQGKGVDETSFSGTK